MFKQFVQFKSARVLRFKSAQSANSTQSESACMPHSCAAGLLRFKSARVAFSAALACALSAFVACSNEKVAGGTEAESTIALQLQLADGNPAAAARVRILPHNYLSDGMDSVDWVSADDSGRVEFAKMAAGAYTVEARSVENSKAAGAITSFDFDPSAGSSNDTLNLDELSVIEGFVAAGQGPSVIRIPGLDRFVVPDSAGHFVIDSLPPGDFEIFIESRSNRGSVTLQASSGEKVPEVNLGSPRGFAVENFESFSGKSATGEILGDGWWYTLDADGKNLMPLWDETLTRTYSGSVGCASGGCARTTDRLGFLLGAYKKDYALNGLDTLMFSARGSGTLKVSLAYGDADSVESGFTYDVELSKVWQGYAIPVKKMKAYGKASLKNILVSRIDFRMGKGDTLFLDDVFLGGIDRESLDSVAVPGEDASSSYPKDWSDHDALLEEMAGYAVGTRGGAGPLGDSLNPVDVSEIQGSICVVTTTADYVIVEDTTKLDSAGNATMTVITAPGSLRECAYRDSATWILFEKSGTYNLTSVLRIKSNKTIDGRGRDIRITGMGIQTNESENLIFENLTFTAPAITVQDSSSRRALSIHNRTHHVWVDHCTFEEYPLVELDVKRGSHDVTVSWSRFENAQSGILFGLEPDLYVDSGQTLTLHHNYFANMSQSGVYARYGLLHAYNNFFLDVDYAGVECTDSASCLLERNVFNIAQPSVLYRLFDPETGAPVESSKGYVRMRDNWFSNGGEELAGDALGYLPDYKVDFDAADAELAWRVKEWSGPR